MIPDKDEKIIVYCGLDLRAPLSTRTMNELGYRNAVNMIDGLKAWKEAGYPTAKQSSRAEQIEGILLHDTMNHVVLTKIKGRRIFSGLC